ncbi:transcriptional repressor brinker [Musca autumnalis]|uniref:transcriptional repressor brinker n=1 Tax=Musca autumnalis TaxID=221902 RepID=UPI003CFB5FB0
MEHNEKKLVKNLENLPQSVNTNNGHITVSHECGDTATQAEIICKKTEGGCPNTPTGNGSSGHKMGSRRIFTPQFKLQVLESYRNDNDCKGNQRATARKYNIHRRQIQKWLQCESSLRSSVANINQNTVKHQFHNISVHQHQQQGQKSGVPVPSVPLINNHHTHLGLDVTRTDVAHIVMPPLSSGVTTSTTQTQGVFSAADLAAVVAAAAGAAMTITSAPSTNGSSGSSESLSSSSLRPPSIIGASGSAAATMSPLLHHHHHHYGIPTYIHHTPATVQLPVPILARHISHAPHIHQQAQQHQAYQYLAYTQPLTHQSSDKQQQQSSFLSSISLTDVSALSTAASLASGNGFSAELRESELKDSAETHQSCCKKDIENSEKEQNGSKSSSGSKVSIYTDLECSGSNLHPLYKIEEDGYQMVYPLGPMDLSLRPRRDLKTELHVDPKIQETKSNIVDLTHRKRKVSSTAYNISDHGQSEISEEKHPKIMGSTEEESKNSLNSNSDDDEVEIEVGTEEKLPPSKPVKLFKPYLLDADSDSESSNTAPLTTTSDVKYNESNDTSPWIRYTSSISPPPHCYDTSTGQCHGATFQYSPLKENFTSAMLPIENSNFPGDFKVENLKSAFTSVPIISPTSFRCPKGSPSSSGYESSSSTYSDSSFSSRAESYAYNSTYSLSLQMRSIHNDQLNLHRSKHVERWLEQESRNSSETNTPIAILA